MNLEQEYDEAEDKRLVARLIDTGFFEEEWTDYYAETDAEDDDNGGDEAEVEYLAKDCVAGSGAVEGTESQSNVPVFIKDSTDTLNDFQCGDGDNDDTVSTRFTFPAPASASGVMVTNNRPVVLPKVYDYDFVATKFRCRCPPGSSRNPTNMKFAAMMSQLRRLFMITSVN